MKTETIKRIALAIVLATALAIATAAMGQSQATQKIHFTWDPNPPEDGELFYRVYRRIAGETQDTKVWEGPETQSQAFDLVPGQRYIYTVTAVNTAELESLPSDPQSDVPAQVVNFKAVFEVTIGQ